MADNAGGAWDVWLVLTFLLLGGAAVAAFVRAWLAVRYRDHGYRVFLRDQRARAAWRKMLEESEPKGKEKRDA